MAVKEKLTKDSGVAGAFDYNHIVAKLLAKPKARGKSSYFFEVVFFIVMNLETFHKYSMLQSGRGQKDE